jgi:hypothetical protein
MEGEQRLKVGIEGEERGTGMNLVEVDEVQAACEVQRT